MDKRLTEIEYEAPIAGPAGEEVHLNHPGMPNGRLVYDSATLLIKSQSGAYPVGITKPEIETYNPGRRIPDLTQTPQPRVRSCSRPVKGANGGCECWEYCPVGRKFPNGVGPGPFNVIASHQGVGAPTSMPCYHYWSGRTAAGLPASQVRYRDMGWKLVLNQITEPVMSTNNWKDASGNVIAAKKTEEVQVPVQNLGPMYWELLQKEGKPLPPQAAAFTGEAVRKKRGRPRGSRSSSGTSNS